MGQHYIIVNADKREYFEPMDFKEGAKLKEWCGNSSHTTLALQYKLANEWHGDRVYALGDYSHQIKPGETRYGVIQSMTKEFGTDNIYMNMRWNISQTFLMLVPLQIWDIDSCTTTPQNRS